MAILRGIQNMVGQVAAHACEVAPLLRSLSDLMAVLEARVLAQKSF